MRPNEKIFSIYNAKIVTPDEVINNGSVIIDKGKIIEIVPPGGPHGDGRFAPGGAPGP